MRVVFGVVTVAMYGIHELACYFPYEGDVCSHDWVVVWTWDLHHPF